MNDSIERMRRRAQEIEERNRRASEDSRRQRGITYFREIGSYPELKSYPDAGRSAEDVAAERCARTLTAF